MNPLLALVALLAAAPPAGKASTKPKPTDAERERAEAAEISQVLKAGPLPDPVTLSKDATLGATLGVEIGEKAPPPLTFGKQRVTIPAGCSATPMVGGGEIHCPRGQVLWSTPDDEMAVRAALQRVLKSQVGKDRGTSEEVPCRIAGVRALCQRTRVEAKTGPTTYLTGVVLDGTTVLAALCWVEGTNLNVPPCGVAFEVR